MNSFSSTPPPIVHPVSKTGVVTPMRRLRVLNVLVFFAFWCVIICGRLIWLQVFCHGEWVERAARQQQHTFEVAPRRGVLYDRNLHELAMTVLADSIFAVPSEIGSDKAETAAALAKIVHTDPTDNFTSEQQILARLNASHNFAWIARKQDAALVARVKALNLKGVYVHKEFKRFYPDNDLAAQVLGYVGIDDNGLGGLEENFDDDLHGTPGRMLTSVDARRHVLGSEEREPLPGENLVLTIDENIQFMAEKALDANMARTHAEYGTIVVQDPHTGQILALAVRPTFNPNDFRHATTNLLKNHAVSDVYEPGSTFKPVTYAAALEEKAITPDTMIDCGGGQLNIAGHTVHDAPGEHMGLVPASKALAMSSNVGAIHVGERVGAERLYKYIRAFGFGDRSGIELPAETRGLLEPLRHWGPSTMGAVPMGQEVAVTPIQIATMISTIANGGMYLPPRVLLESAGELKAGQKLEPATFHPGTDLPNPLPEGAHRVISTLTAAEMRKMMEGVITEGTARTLGPLNGYSAAGKTGTAQKIDPHTHTYSKTKFVASFVGFAPVNDPAVTIAVVMDSPDHSMHFGVEASGPVFHDLAQQILEYLRVPHDEPLKSPALLAKAEKTADIDDVPEEHAEDLDSLFSEVNNLPADDPLRSGQPVQKQAPLSKEDMNKQTAIVANRNPTAVSSEASTLASDERLLKAKIEEKASAQASSSMISTPQARPTDTGAVVLAAGNRVSVPSFAGEPVRKVVEVAGGMGLGVQVLGTGIARNQFPAPGTMVPQGTAIVVRFGR